MKKVSIAEAKSKLEFYAALCRKESVVVTLNGHPIFEMKPRSDGDDLVNQLIEGNSKFRKMLAARAQRIRTADGLPGIRGFPSTCRLAARWRC